MTINDNPYPPGSVGAHIEDIAARIEELPWPLCWMMRRKFRRIRTYKQMRADEVLVRAWNQWPG